MTTGWAPGTNFAGYRIEAVIGRGGMGVVYRATDLSLRRPVALKLIVPELAEDERFRMRFLDESRLAASLEHPGVVAIHQSGEAEGQLFLAMRCVDGHDLRALLPLPRERTFALLEQIASALDAAHRHGLVHRDVKPANILVDEDDHAFLTDFGVSKQLGGVTTDTGRLVGSLDYLAPEQIAGERVDPRTDQYALACVLYECLTGVPAFRRESEAETLWAHMQVQFAPVPGLERVLRRAFARDPNARYTDCMDLVAAARAGDPARRWRIVAGLAVGVAVAATVALLARDGDLSLPSGSGVAALGADGALRSFTIAETAPSNIAVGEGAVWVVDGGSERVSRIDPSTGAVKRFTAGSRPSDVAAGGGALWVGNSGDDWPGWTTGISRVDPRSLKVTGTVKVAPETIVFATRTPGLPQIAVGAGAVWAISLDNRVYRIDLATGRTVARFPVAVGTRTLAAGNEGVWTLAEGSTTVERIDPVANRVARRIRVDGGDLSGIAVGAGAVWITSPREGRLWRIDAGTPARRRSIDVGEGVSFVSFADGAVWTANFMDGTVRRIDARTNAVTATIRAGTPQALVAGAGAAWVGVIAGAREGTLPSPVCDTVEAGGAAEPDVLIASDFGLQGEGGHINRGLTDAIRWVLREHGFRAGEHAVGYQSCDDSTAQSGQFESRRCAANAHALAGAEPVVAVIGPEDSDCAAVEIPILNRAPGGPLALVSPMNYEPDLTRGPRRALYPTGARNYARVVARADLHGVAHAMLAKALGLERVYLLDTADTSSRETVTDPFRRAAERLGVGIAGAAQFDRAARSYSSLADRVARSHPDGVVVAGYANSGGTRMIKALRARLGRRVKLMVGEEFGYVADILAGAGSAARGVYITSSEVLADAPTMTPAGEHFVATFGEAARGGYALHAAQAAEVVLQAIAESDGTRASVLQALHSLRIEKGILGTFAFDRNGDMTPATVTIARITGVTTPDVRLPLALQGAVVDRMLPVPDSLSR